MPTARRRLGDKGEALAAQFLERKNYKILEKNFLVRQGEIDIIAKKENEIIFIEVKTRSNTRFGDLTETISKAKEERLALAIEKYLEKNKIADDIDYRIDIITVDISSFPAKIEHFENAFA